MSLLGRAMLPQAFFLPTGSGKRFCLFHPAPGDFVRGCVLYLHPFAEELNCTRRVAAQQARALALAGYCVLQIDLLGCGDSAGHFADATWEAWLQDARLARHWLREHASGPLWLWGMRAGALLATALAKDLSEPCHLLLWQPVVSGQQQQQQFLRLHTASQWLGADRASGQTPSQMLNNGQPADIAGYTLSPALARGLAAARLEPPPCPSGQLVWLELSVQAEPALSPASEKQLAVWRDAGWAVSAQALTGPLFWQTVGTDDAPALVQATLDALAKTPAQAAPP
ncbi:hydrolase 2, exosortase A system-associated [Acidovorax carolinensis]|uniref:Hydrolase 2, exosortase A system-associated n=1 Tax=Acidovorax carolinensis TaxID=553814 RepID=A0A240U6R0_9BURK|nr:hydrolase 2, exosortase A system-associated [Acidovorax carolinensis]ART53134.1 hydrolase 2, exosortase A system-associated [Acidovorax carolinensis]